MRFAVDAWPCRCGFSLTHPTLRGAETPRFPRSHPPNFGRFFLPSRFTDCLAIDDPGRTLFPGGDGETQCSPFPKRWIVPYPATCEGCSARSLRSPLSLRDGETQCSTIHSAEAQNGSSLRSQAVTPHCVLPLAGAGNGLSTRHQVCGANKRHGHAVCPPIAVASFMLPCISSFCFVRLPNPDLTH
jgi:hypothetical protein